MIPDTTEARAAESLLDNRLRIHIPAPLLLRLFGKKMISLWFRRPTGAQLLRISALYVRMDIDLKTLDEGDTPVLFEHIARHAVHCSRIIAHGLIRSGPAASFLARPLGSYLLHYMDMQSLAELTKLIVFLSGGENFASIIRSIAHMKITAPIVSHQETES
jgi:hypothetical protein